MKMYSCVKILFIAILITFTIAGTGCATKKYVRQTVNERVTPLEGRTQELEETVRRNTQEIRDVEDRLSKRIDDVGVKVDRAQSTADSANARAEAADLRAAGAEQRVEDLRQNLDKYTQLTTVAVNFKLNSSDLNDEARLQLDNLALEAKNHKGFILEIQGFTDSSGGDKLNEKLSQDRAESVQRYLARQHQIPTYKMSILGLGKIEEDLAGLSRVEKKEVRARNRKVEVRLLINNAVSPSGQTIP
ncbi:MAG: OmpA family protein [Blastocatellia bacterium]|nr:OmpA family protein [Blastocatellia bacterium]